VSCRQVLHAIRPVLLRIGSLPPNLSRLLLLRLHLSGGVVFNSEMINDYFNCDGFPGLEQHISTVLFEAMRKRVLDFLCSARSSLQPIQRFGRGVCRGRRDHLGAVSALGKRLSVPSPRCPSPLECGFRWIPRTLVREFDRVLARSVR
jgi:hypothetical protein